MGKWIKKADLKADLKRHECHPPIKLNGIPRGGLGSIWQCDCGREWEVKQNVIAYYPGKPDKPVFGWGKYGNEDFGLRSALAKEEK